MSSCNYFQLFVELSETLFISISVFLAKPVGGKMCHPLHSLQPWFQLHSNLVFRFVFCSFFVFLFIVTLVSSFDYAIFKALYPVTLLFSVFDVWSFRHKNVFVLFFLYKVNS